MLLSPLQIMSVMDIGDGTFEFFFYRGGQGGRKIHKRYFLGAFFSNLPVVFFDQFL